MRVGTINYSHSRGLGHLAKSFIDAKIIDDIHVIRHPGIPMKEWYPNAPISDIRRVSVSDEWLKTHDAMLLFETPFDWDIIQRCKLLGVRTYLVPMYECTPEVLPYIPDVFLCPSLLDLQEFPAQGNTKSFIAPIPLSPDIKWKLRSTALHFVHNGGYLGMRGREGTELLIEAMRYVTSPVRLTIRVQENVSKYHQALMARDSRIEYINHSVPYEDLYKEGDVSILPQKFNGMSMPLMESRASGMLVMTTNRFPTNDWLCGEGALIPVRSFQQVRLSPRFRVIEEAQIDPLAIARTIDSYYGIDIKEQSDCGLDYSYHNSFDMLRSMWLKLLEI